MPDKERLVFSVPPGFGSVAAFRAKVIARLTELERAAAAEREAKGMRVLGVRADRKQRQSRGTPSGPPPTSSAACAARNFTLRVRSDNKFLETDAADSAQAAKGADLLVHDCTLGDAESDRAVETKHSTAREAAAVAREAGVGRLVLTHLSSRYDREWQPLVAQAREVFPGPVDVAQDGWVVELRESVP